MMKEIFQKYPRFSRLLDQLCEQSLDQKGADEISRIVKSDPVARDYYVRYLELHSSLHWDLAIPNRTGEGNQAQQQSLQHDQRLKQLVEQFVNDAVFEPVELHSKIDNRTDAARAVSRRKRNVFWAAGLALTLTMAVGGLWFSRPIQPDPILDQVERKQSNGPEKIVASERTEEKIEDELPPRLPEIKWHQQTGSSSTAQVSEKQEKSQSDAKPVPVLKDDKQIIAAINHWIEQGWSDQSVRPSPVAEDDQWCRRIYLDLAGRVPSAKELKQFLDDKRPERERRLVDRLLETPEFAMNWATRWTNLLVGRSPNERVDRLALLKYLRNSIAQNDPWSLVVRDLISAQGDPRVNGPANFLVAHLNNQAVPATAFVARTLLGTQIQCAQCHRHPFYETTQQQFWELNSFFKQARVVSSSQMSADSKKKEKAYVLTDQQIGGPTYYETRSGLMQVAYPRFNGHKVSEDKSVSRRQELAKLLVQGDDPLIAQSFVNRTWSHFFGYGFTHPIDDIGPHNPPSHPDLFRTLSRSFVASDYDIKRLVRWICLSKPYRLSSFTTSANNKDTPQWGDPPAFTHMYFKPLSPEQLYNSLVEISGTFPRSNTQWNQHIRARESWVSQFVDSLENDENAESNHFQGTITQALMMMNGELIAQTISRNENRLVSDLVERPGSDLEKFEAISLSVLSRKPKPKEILFFRKMIYQLRDSSSPAERKQILATCLEDAMWAYLNSSEFIINH